MAGEIQDVSHEDMCQSVVDFQHGQVEHMLHYVVAVGVLDQLDAVLNDLVDEGVALCHCGSVNTPLQHTAAMAVCGDLHGVVHHSVVDELVKGGLQ